MLINNKENSEQIKNLLQPSAIPKSEGLFGLRLIAPLELFHISGSGERKVEKEQMKKIR